jgi:acetoin utilization deacetylase AcuC-like enzyme
MGFCLYNNIAVAAETALSEGLERIAIIDWDVHHGNGTQDIFYEDGDVFFFSSHQWPLYPGTGRADETGEGKGLGATMNFPFPAGSGRKEILGAVENALLPEAARFRPELVLISAGFDSRVGDPLGAFTLTDQDFRDLTHAIMGIADQYSDGRLVSLLEGGYNLHGLGAAAAMHAGEMLLQ